jgi:hypothetical protein
MGLKSPYAGVLLAFGRLLRIALATGASFLLGTPALASAGEREIPRVGALPAVGHEHLADTVIERAAPVLRAAGTRGTRAVRYATSDGLSVEVEVSTSYPANPEGDQKLVDFLASRTHGYELGSLRVFVGTPAEIARLCQDEDAVACYATAEDRMYVPGESVRGVPVEYALTHEYGHHLASWRSNSPWEALDWGAKFWASEMRVCTHVARGRLFPGDQGEHYLQDPGEGFADGYAHLHYPRTPWQYSELLRPGRDSYTAIRRDVLRPWTGPRSRTLRGRLGPRRGSRSLKLRMRLDGDVTVRLDAARALAAQVELEAGSFASGETLHDGQGFGLEWCRRTESELVTVTVRRRAGRGRFALRLSYSG